MTRNRWWLWILYNYPMIPNTSRSVMKFFIYSYSLSSEVEQATDIRSFSARSVSKGMFMLEFSQETFF
jgi:hypothetical protein